MSRFRRGGFLHGTATVALGMAFFSLANYAFLATATRVLGPGGFAQFNVFWGLVYGVGLGVFLPFEQEVSRRTASAGGEGSVAAVAGAGHRTALLTALGLTLVTAPLGLLYTSVQRLPVLVVACGAAYGALAVAYVSRGSLSGQQRFGRYATQLTIEGAVRLLAVAALVLSATRVLAWYYAVVPVALFVAVLATAPVRPSRDRRPAQGPLWRQVAPLVVSSTASQSLINLGPLTITLMLPDEDPLAGAFLAAALVTRLPILAFAAVQAVLIPRLVGSVVRRDRAGFVRGVRTAVLPTAALGVLGVLLIGAVGPFLLRLVAGKEYVLGRPEMALLATSVALFMVCLVLQSAAVSLQQHQAAAVAWVLACVALLPGLLLPLTPSTTVAVSLIVAFATGCAALLVVVRRGVARLDWAADEADGVAQPPQPLRSADPASGGTLPG